MGPRGGRKIPRRAGKGLDPDRQPLLPVHPHGGGDRRTSEARHHRRVQPRTRQGRRRTGAEGEDRIPHRGRPGRHHVPCTETIRRLRHRRGRGLSRSHVEHQGTIRQKQM